MCLRVFNYRLRFRVLRVFRVFRELRVFLAYANGSMPNFSL